jgi:hypothetical protein
MKPLLFAAHAALLSLALTSGCSSAGRLTTNEHPDSGASPDGAAGPEQDASSGDSAPPVQPLGTSCVAAGGTCISSWGGDSCALQDGNWAAGATDDCSDGTEASYACCIPGSVTAFTCGPSLQCDAPFQLCEITSGGAALPDGGTPVSYACSLAPGQCSPGFSCACVTAALDPELPIQQCSESSGNVTVTHDVTPFPCGPSLACDASIQICVITEGADGGSPTSYTCEGQPGPCIGQPITCACVKDGDIVAPCSQSNGGITVTIPAPP